MTSTRRALVVIDVQQEYFDGPLQIQFPPPETSLTNVIRAIDVAVAADLPVVVVRHEGPAESPVFGRGSTGAQLHPQITEKVLPTWKESTKQVASVLADTSVVDWLREQGVGTITLVGYMTNNCVIGSAAAAEPLGFAVEVLSDATGAINIANGAGTVPAEQVHRTLMALLHSNFAAVATTAAWTEAVQQDEALESSNLVRSAVDGLASAG
ncbi:MAG: isochorismatase family protein [Nakamurella sp.]